MKTRKIQMSMHRMRVDFLKSDGTLMMAKDVNIAKGHRFQLYYDGMLIKNALKIELPTLDSGEMSKALATVTVIDDPKFADLLQTIKKLIRPINISKL
jgi:hypothetical protein